LRFRDPQAAVELAELATAGVAWLEGHGFGRSGLCAWRCLCWAELGNAYRLANEMDLAWYALSRASQWADRGRGDLAAVSRIGGFLVGHLTDLKRYEDALTILEQLENLYERLGRPRQVGETLVKKGRLRAALGDTESALRLTAEGLRALRPEAAKVAAEEVLDLIDFAVRCDARAASKLLWHARACGLLPCDSSSEFRLHWAEGQIFLKLGAAPRAEAALRSARQGFKRTGLLALWALAGLDLARLWVPQGRREEVGELAEELLAALGEEEAGWEALGAIELLKRDSAQGRASVEVLQKRIDVVATLLTDDQRMLSGDDERRCWREE
jgi:hypothetical protein